MVSLFVMYLGLCTQRSSIFVEALPKWAGNISEQYVLFHGVRDGFHHLLLPYESPCKLSSCLCCLWPLLFTVSSMAAVGVIDIVGRFAYLCCSLVWDDSYTSPIATVDRRAELMGVTTGITFICWWTWKWGNNKVSDNSCFVLIQWFKT